MDSNGHASEGEQAAPEKDAREGKTVRRGQGTFELRDVPWVQYFAAGFALHTAYWHDVFGVARSHGCVNLSPIDGHWLFGFTDPPVPQGWHGVEAGTDTPAGTTVFIHK
jgi:lipoprotein-anchoring transpeptidase ErfK/SrfK